MCLWRRRFGTGVARVLLVAVGALLMMPAVGCASARPRAKPPERDPEPAVQARELTWLEPAEVLAGVRRNGGELGACFSSDSPTAQGWARLSWTILPSGIGSQARVETTTIVDEDTLHCLTMTLESAFFGIRPATPLRASWTFVHQLAKAPRKERGRRRRNTGFVVERSSPGHLERFDIQSTVGGGFGLYAYCLREGLERDPSLKGLVRLGFVIDRDGSVIRIVDRGSDLKDQRSIDCVAEGFLQLKFPRPEQGEVHVTYPVLFNES